MTFEFDPLAWVPVLAHVVLAPATAAHALLNKRDSRSAFGWIAVCLLFPLAGPALYGVFGINRVSTRARQLSGAPGPNIDAPLPASPAVAPGRVPDEYRLLAKISESVSGRPLLAGDEVVPLHNGEQAFPAMLEAIEAASRRVYLATYIFESNRTGHDFVAALAAAGRRGVDVRVLIDGMGELYSWPRARRALKREGVNARRFLSLRLIPPTMRVNLRNHRKILVVDDQVGFAGGMNIGDRHLTEDPAVKDPTTDVHFRFSGPILAELEQVFIESWNFATGDRLEPTSPSVIAPAGRSLCRAIADGPNEDLDKLSTVMVGAISAARSRVAIMTPYFLPSREMISALQSAALRGVDVAVILPERNNLPFVHWATRKMLWELLLRGVGVYYQPPPFSHSKLFVVDAHYSLVGSANIDPRSLRLNFELGVEIHDPKTAVRLLAHFDEICEMSRNATLAELDGRSLPVQLRDGLFWLFSPYL